MFSIFTVQFTTVLGKVYKLYATITLNIFNLTFWGERQADRPQITLETEPQAGLC